MPEALENIKISISESKGCIYVRVQQDVLDGSAITGSGDCLVEALRELANAIVWTKTNAPIWKDPKVIGRREP